MFGVFVPVSCGHKVVTTPIVVLLLLCVVCCPVAAVCSGGGPSIPDSTKLCTGCNVSEVESWKNDPFESDLVSNLVSERLSLFNVLLKMLGVFGHCSDGEYKHSTLREVSNDLVKSGYVLVGSGCFSYDVLDNYSEFKKNIREPYVLPECTGARVFVWNYWFDKCDSAGNCDRVLFCQHRLGLIENDPRLGEVVCFVGEPFIAI